MCGDEPKASNSKIGKRQKQGHHHEKPNDGHLQRDGTALIRKQGRGGQFVFSGQDCSFSQSVTPGVTLTLKTSGSERLAAE
jgi:hypothetical protein